MSVVGVGSGAVSQVTRKIWIYWHQGFGNAPQLVSACARSWSLRNPGWEVIFLDQWNVDGYVNLDISPKKLASLSLAKRANLIRLELLYLYGGVWADATTFCMSPLDDWIDGVTELSGVFMFYKPGRDRLISNWFISAYPKNPLILGINKRLLRFHRMAPADNFGPFRRRLIKFFSKRLNRNVATSRCWLIWFFPKVLRIYPYFIFHYIFADMLAREPALRECFERMPKISAGKPHILQEYGLFSKMREEVRLELDCPSAPLYKLHWRPNNSAVPHGSVLEQLLSGVG